MKVHTSVKRHHKPPDSVEPPTPPTLSELIAAVSAQLAYNLQGKAPHRSASDDTPPSDTPA